MIIFLPQVLNYHLNLIIGDTLDTQKHDVFLKILKRIIFLQKSIQTFTEQKSQFVQTDVVLSVMNKDRL